LFADRQPFQKRRVGSEPKTISLVCVNHERITGYLVAQVTPGALII
jgi:hypothetical protein